ncbi:Pex19 protein family-domain-containing protein [Aspergillus arachidicola]|uniref:Pex19 protein family-domain-containing protein n=1 Tax=Aspergillus arachidicola TaxID=656916 RepID=A0A5N6XSG7_9EURO|nr:Pex19 protein family-domain-containing protein [Aspergillus arachidicola]
MSTPSALPVNAGDPQPNDSAPATISAEDVKTATTSATPAPETPAQSADKPQAQPQQPKQAIDDDDDDDDESDLDELDDVLDDFNKPKPAPAPAPAPSASSQPATAPEANDFDEETFMKLLEKDMANMMGHAAKESGTLDDKGFEETINQGADAFTKQLEESGIPPGDFIKQLLADVMAEEEGGDATAKAAAAAPSTGSAGSSSGGAGAGAPPPESFNDAIQQTMNRMKESGDKATAAASEDDPNDLMAQLMKAVALNVDGEEEDGGFMNIVSSLMEQLSNKEMLYEPMKELNGKFGPWLLENKGNKKFTDEEWERFEKQATISSQIVAKFEEPGYTDEDPKCREYVWQKMQEMQAAGSPPEELVANPFGEENTGPGGMPDCPQQ